MPDEAYLKSTMELAKTEAQVLEVWGMVIKHQPTLGSKATWSLRNLRDARLKECHP